MSEMASTFEMNISGPVKMLGESLGTALDLFTPRRTPESQFSFEKFMRSRALSEEKLLKGLISRMRAAVRSHDMVQGNAAALSLLAAMRKSFARMASDNQSSSVLAISARALKSAAKELKNERNFVVNERLQEDLRHICSDISLAAEMAEQQKAIRKRTHKSAIGVP